METQTTISPDHLLEEGHYAGFLRRAGAAIIDGLILGTVGKWIGLLIFSPEDLRLAAFSGLLGLLYYAMMESSKHQGTIGKIFLKIKVTDLDGNKINFIRATVRHLSKILSGIILGIGFLMVLWTDRKQGLHDIIAKTLVVKR
jgi:uncharacterized RDD family membrane protein YckC